MIVILDSSDFLNGPVQSSAPADLGIQTSHSATYLIKKEGDDKIIIVASPVKKRTCDMLVNEQTGYLEDIIANPASSHHCEDNEMNEGER